MRISDWSSDVCSSDLGDRQRHRIDPADERDHLVAELDDAAVLCVLAEDDVGDLGRERREQPALQGAQELRRGILRVDRVGILVFVLRRRDAEQMRGIERVAAETGRSEEHTSELQSLMRISYAVFCLKNKTTKR